jgi:hypothetical protein
VASVIHEGVAAPPEEGEGLRRDALPGSHPGEKGEKREGLWRARYAAMRSQSADRSATMGGG